MPAQTIITNFNIGIDAVVQTITESQKKPVIVGIHGDPNSGKSRLIAEVKKQLDPKEIYGWSGMQGDPVEKCGARSVKQPDYFLIEDTGAATPLDLYAQKTLGRFPDLRVCMCRRLTKDSVLELMRNQSIGGSYNLVIENPDSIDK